MPDNLLAEQEHFLRLGVFLLGLAFFWLAGIYFPYRQSVIRERFQYWLNNLGILVLNTLILRLVAPISLTALALMATDKGWGLLYVFGLPEPVHILIAFLLLDLGIYWQHRLTHCLPILWKLHRLHHSDTELDVTTAGRFHLLEILISFAIKAVLIIFIGAPALAVVIFEIMLNLCAMFTHANISLPKRIEPVLRTLIVTPDMHRIHHSSRPSETDSNYGFCLSVWDRLFKSHIKNARNNPRTMEVGLKEFRLPEEQKLKALLLQPFK